MHENGSRTPEILSAHPRVLNYQYYRHERALRLLSSLEWTAVVKLHFSNTDLHDGSDRQPDADTECAATDNGLTFWAMSG